MPNKYFKCKNCGRDFYFSEKDQKFYSEKGYADPKNCWHCRQKRKAEKEASIDSENS